jgi:peroxiredoxin
VEVGFSDRPVKYTFDFTRWDTNAELKEGTFTFTPPADAEKVPSVQKRFHEKVMAEAGRQAPKAPLLGEEAPDFTLQTLDGKDVTLAQHEGKDVVILDFWASWCAPCRRGLPILEKVATEFADKNVVLYPVNLLEPKVQAERAAEMLKLTSTVLLDTKGEVGDKFGVGPIPHSVIIDKDGIVQAVHQGISASYESELRHELETLTSGQSLVSAAPKAAKGATE